jgi:hypothetical protein
MKTKAKQALKLVVDKVVAGSKIADASSTAESKPEATDPWANRHAGMQCRTCVYFVLKNPRGLEPVRLGRCRRHAPTMNGYPVVFLHDFCGDHKLDENKI